MKDVVIYTSDGCQYCHAAKDYMDENNIKYTEKNISQDQEARTYEKRSHGCTCYDHR